MTYALVDFDRLRSLDSERSVPRLSGLPPKLILDLSDRGEELPAVIAEDPFAFGCIVWDSDVGAPALTALKMDPVNGHEVSPGNDSTARS